MKQWTEELYMRYRPLLFSIAYRMLGKIDDAEEIVQDTFAGLNSDYLEQVTNMKSYLCKSVVNRCLNELKTARRRRQQYVGPWLPEPLMREEEQPAVLTENREALSYAFLVLLDRLSPTERAVFVLRTAYEYEYAEISMIIGKTDVYARKLYSTAKKKLQPNSELANKPLPVNRRNQLEAFLSSFQRCDVDSLMNLMNEDAVLITDGGGKVRAALNPIYSRKRTAILLEVIARGNLAGSNAVIERVNGRDELLFYKNHKLSAVFCFAWNETGEYIDTIYVIFNPDKLRKQ